MGDRGAGFGDDEQAAGDGISSQVIHDLERGLVALLEIREVDHERFLHRHRGEEGADVVREPEPLGGRGQSRPASIGSASVLAIRQASQKGRVLGLHRRSSEGGRLAHDPRHRSQRAGLTVAGPGRHRHAGEHQLLEEGSDEARLPAAGLAGHQDHLARTGLELRGPHPREEIREHPELRRAFEELAEPEPALPDRSLL